MEPYKRALLQELSRETDFLSQVPDRTAMAWQLAALAQAREHPDGDAARGHRRDSRGCVRLQHPDRTQGAPESDDNLGGRRSVGGVP